jgi:hypothetical protein
MSLVDAGGLVMGLLNRLLFGNAKQREEQMKFNKVVEDFVTANFDIDLDNITDSYYNKNTMYQNLFKLYNMGCNANEAVAVTVGDYLSGMLRKSGMTEEASNRARKLVMFVEECANRNHFSKGRADRLLSMLENEAMEYASKVA